MTPCKPQVPEHRSRVGFTLVELLVVIGIIALLLSILLPTLSGVRDRANEVKCASNLRQWGQAYLIYTNQSKGLLADEGDDGDAAGVNAAIKYWDAEFIWFNALPPLVAGRSFWELHEATVAGNPSLPGPGRSTIFNCPNADLAGDNSPANVGSDGRHRTFGFVLGNGTPTALQIDTYFCYVPNSELNNPLPNRDPPLPPGTALRKPMPRIAQLRPAASVVLMIEKRMTPGEIPQPDNAFYAAVANRPIDRLITRTLNRTRGEWQRIAARHRKGSNVVFADGHVEWRSHRDLITPGVAAAANSFGIPTNPGAPQGDWNRPDLVWTPFGQAPR